MSTLKPRRVSEAPRILFRTLDLTEAYHEFGLDPDQIYAAAHRGEVHPVARPPRDRRSLKGQIEYPEWELSKLAERLGLTVPRIIELPDGEPRLSYVHGIAA